MKYYFKGVLLGLVLSVLTPPAWGVHLRGKVERVGFRGLGSSSSRGWLYRSDRWLPILLELSNDDSDLFDGTIEVSQPDRDGDVVVARRQVAVRGVNRYYLYVPGGANSHWQGKGLRIRVLDRQDKLADLHDDTGKPIRQLPVPQMFPTESDCRVVIDISPEPLSPLTLLANDSGAQTPMIVGKMTLAQLPDHRLGMDFADVMIWDDVDPSQLDVGQRVALIDWVRAGGTLILGVGKNAELLAKSSFAELLPARLGSARTVTHAREMTDMIWGDASDVLSLDKPLTVAQVHPDDLYPDARMIVPDRGQSVVGMEDGDRQVYLSRRPIGSGAVILATANLADIMRVGVSGNHLFRLLLNIRPAVEELDGSMYYSEHDLYDDLVVPISFSATSGAYFVFALFFIMGYIALATLGSWHWLRRGQRRRYAWFAFAAIAVAISAVSLVSVRVIRWMGSGVHEVAVVDMRAGSYDAVAQCLFGLKTGSHMEMDLAVPSDWLNLEDLGLQTCSLRGLSAYEDTGFPQSQYAAAKTYEAVPAQSSLRRVPIRATLKQFEATWLGKANGQLNSGLYRVDSGRTELIETRSWIRNDLGVDLFECCLLVTRLPIYSGQSNATARKPTQVMVYDLGDMEAGDRLVLAERDAELKTDKKGRLWYRNLDTMHGLWLRALRIQTDDPWRSQEQDRHVPRDRPINALKLLTTFEEKQLTTQYQQVVRSAGLRIDRTEEIGPETALFIGFSRQPSPVRLCYEKPGLFQNQWKPLHPRQSLVMYRVAVPIQVGP